MSTGRSRDLPKEASVGRDFHGVKLSRPQNFRSVIGSAPVEADGEGSEEPFLQDGDGCVEFRRAAAAAERGGAGGAAAADAREAARDGGEEEEDRLALRQIS